VDPFLECCLSGATIDGDRYQRKANRQLFSHFAKIFLALRKRFREIQKRVEIHAESIEKGMESTILHGTRIAEDSEQKSCIEKVPPKGVRKVQRRRGARGQG
jgi:hypothetical protein